MPEKNPLENYGYLDKSATPSPESAKDDTAEALNMLRANLAEVMEKDYRGDEQQKIRDMEDIQSQIEKLEKRQAAGEEE